MSLSSRPIIKAILLAWPLVVFLLGVAALIVLVSNEYLMPAGDAVLDATPKQKKLISAYSALLLSIVLLIITTGLFMVYRHRRATRALLMPSAKDKPTKVVDAWAESGKRLKQ